MIQLMPNGTDFREKFANSWVYQSLLPSTVTTTGSLRDHRDQCEQRESLRHVVLTVVLNACSVPQRAQRCGKPLGEIHLGLPTQDFLRLPRIESRVVQVEVRSADDKSGGLMLSTLQVSSTTAASASMGFSGRRGPNAGWFATCAIVCNISCRGTAFGPATINSRFAAVGAVHAAGMRRRDRSHRSCAAVPRPDRTAGNAPSAPSGTASAIAHRAVRKRQRDGG